MDDDQKRLLERLLDIGEILERNGEGRIEVRKTKDHGIETRQEEEMHVLFLDGKRLGIAFEYMASISVTAGSGFSLLPLSQSMSLLKGKGCVRAYDAARGACSELEDMIEPSLRQKWTDIFSIPGRKMGASDSEKSGTES